MLWQRARGAVKGIALLCLLVVVTTSCGGAPPTTGGGNSPGAASAPPRAIDDFDPALAASDQVLKFAVASEPTTLDPTAVKETSEVGHVMLVFAPLMRFDKDLKVVPGVAESFTVTDDGLTYTFKLRQGTTFSDGVPVKAQHFVYAYRRLVDPRTVAPYASKVDVIQGAEELRKAPKDTAPAELDKLRGALGVRATDDSTLVFKLRHPAAYFPATTALWYSVPIREELVAKAGEKWPTVETFIGNGPFILDRFEQQSRLVYRANPQYYLKPAKLSRVEIIIQGDAATTFAAYRSGELHYRSVRGEDLRVVTGDPQLSQEVLRWPGTCTRYFVFNVKKAPFDNAKVRLAFARAINRDAYIKDMERGTGRALTGLIPPGQPGYLENIPEASFDAEAAKKLLAEAGFSGGQGLPPITISYPSNVEFKVRMEWLADQFKQNLGIEIKLDPVEAKVIQEALRRPETIPMFFLSGWCADYPDPNNWLSFVFRSDSTVLRSGWSNAEFDRLTREADRELDPAKRLELYNQAQKILVQDAPAIFMHSSENVLLKKPFVKNLRVNPLDQFPGVGEIEQVWIAKE
ncbi:MAG: peptide ABC transporter substrate-binding protein [Chloroflexi bacterium]|nr:peptide ABC transporter substrate-binding protein [Chloroflexota bacterium]